MEPGKVNGFEMYKNWLRSKDNSRIDTAIHVLHHTDSRDDEVDAHLIRIIGTNPVDECRRAAVKFAAETGDPKFKQILIDSLGDTCWKIRGFSYLGLKKMPPEEKITAALKDFESKEMHSFCLFLIKSQ